MPPRLPLLSSLQRSLLARARHYSEGTWQGQPKPYTPRESNPSNAGWTKDNRRPYGQRQHEPRTPNEGSDAEPKAYYTGPLRVTGENMVKTYNRAEDFVINNGKGHSVYDTNGRQYLDMTSGIGVVALGHRQQEVINAINQQARSPTCPPPS